MRMKAISAKKILFRIASVLAAVAMVAFVLSVVAPSPAGAWLHLGQSVVYPNEGGKWTYGFWDAKVRSYYYQGYVCHGSSVVCNSSLVRSVDTAPGYTSIAEQWAINYPDAYDAYYHRTCE